MTRFCYSVFTVCLVIITVLGFGCSGNSQSEKPVQNMEEHVYVVNIVQDSLKLKEYLDYHENIWPEVEAGFKKAGYKKIVLYRFQHLLVMTVSVPEGADLGAMGKLAESYSPRCAQWNKLMDGYQQGVPETAPGQKWVEAKPFYTFENQ